jgi:hypothetical protein
MTGAFRTPDGGRIDRARPLTFSFDSRHYTGCHGDTLASALLANGVHRRGGRDHTVFAEQLSLDKQGWHTFGRLRCAKGRMTQIARANLPRFTTFRDVSGSQRGFRSPLGHGSKFLRKLKE